VTADREQTTLRSRAVRAGIWAGFIGIAGTVMRLASSLIMTRLLAPEAFGLIALSGVVYTIITLLSDIGLRQSVVSNGRGGERAFLDTIWCLSAVRGAIISGVSGLVAIGLYFGAHAGWFTEGSVYTDPLLPPVLFFMATTSLVLGFKSPKMYLLERELDLKPLAYIELVAQAVGAVVTVAIAWHWQSVWSIIIAAYVSALITVWLSLYWLPGPIGRMTWEKGAAREIVSYGRWILLSSAIYVFASNADRLLLGVWLTPAALGIYALALNLLQTFEGIVSRPFVTVTMPALSEVARRGVSDFSKAYFRVRLPFDLATVGGAGLLFATGQMLVDIVYDPRYMSAGSTLQILSFSLLFTRYGLATQAHLALGVPQTGSWQGIVGLISIIVFVPIGHAVGGYEGAMWAISLHMVPVVVLIFWINRRFGLNNFRFEILTLLAWPAGYAIGLLGNGVVKQLIKWTGWDLTG
jgi:O-antigen/teichoic acid export membrane protein